MFLSVSKGVKAGSSVKSRFQPRNAPAVVLLMLNSNSSKLLTPVTPVTVAAEAEVFSKTSASVTSWSSDIGTSAHVLPPALTTGSITPINRSMEHHPENLLRHNSALFPCKPRCFSLHQWKYLVPITRIMGLSLIIKKCHIVKKWRREIIIRWKQKSHNRFLAKAVVAIKV